MVSTLTQLQSSDALTVERKLGQIVVRDVARGRTLFALDCNGVLQAGPKDVVRPAPKEPARVVVAERTRRGKTERIYSHSVTSKGARVTVIEPGFVNTSGLHLTVFDNDNFRLSDGRGKLMASHQTDATGTLTERQGASYGCGCERVVTPTGLVTQRPLDKK